MANLAEHERPLSPGWTSLYRDSLLLVAIALVFSLDQITKAVVRHTLFIGESIPRHGPVRITHTFNTGSAFGLFPDQTMFLIIASFVGIAFLLVIYRNPPFSSSLFRLSVGMQLGGAVGNLFDRVRTGQVTDFIDLGVWPVFNVADASIVTGIIVLASLFLLPGIARPGHGRPPGMPLYARADCPLCDSDMNEVPGGWRCSGCGVKEWIEQR